MSRTTVPVIEFAQYKWKDEVARVDELSIDPTYQRHTVHGLVAAIAANYNPILAGKLAVSRRNGCSYIVDGQQRWLGAREAGIQEVGVIGIYGLDAETEARFFLALNEGRVAVRAIDNFRAAYRAKMPYAVQIVDTVEDCGGQIEGIREPGRDDDIAAVKALSWIYQRGGVQGLRETCGVVLEAFGELNQTTAPGSLLRGLFGVISLHRDELDSQRLARQVRKVGVTQLNAIAHGMSQVVGGGAGHRSYYLAILQAYNQRLGKKVIEPASTMNKIGYVWREREEQNAV